MKSDRIAIVKKNIELQVKNSKLDKAFLELEKVTDIMEDQSCKEGWLICKLCTRVGNAIITRYLERNNHFKAISQLRKVEKALNVWENRVEQYLETKTQQGEPEDLFELIITTRNNFSLLHKLQGKYYKALDYLLQAIKITHHLKDSKNPEIIKSISRTQLNTSAIQYEVRKYDSSVNQAKNCLEYLKEELSLRKDTLENKSSVQFIEKYLEMKDEDIANINKVSDIKEDGVQEAFTTIVLVYYNIGVSYEALKNYEEATHQQMLGSTLAKFQLRDDNQIRKLVEDVQQKFKTGLKNRAEINTDDLNIDEKYQEWQKRTEESNLIKNSSLDKQSDKKSNDQSRSNFEKVDSRNTYNVNVDINSTNLHDPAMPSLNDLERPETAGQQAVSKTNYSSASGMKNPNEINNQIKVFNASAQGKMKRESRPKSAVRFTYKPNISKHLTKLNLRLDNISKNSKNQWNLEKITGVEVDMFTSFLKSQGMNEKKLEFK